ncbi:MAG: hypothetical protein M0Q90_04160 [Bacteroidales bacterium]|nr:hypothetical protein [Bacteroidales bacterium]
MKTFKSLTVIAFTALAFLFTQSTEAAELKVYGKGGVSGDHGSGGTTIKICPEASSALCATLTIDIDDLKINGVDGNIIVISKDDIGVFMLPEISPEGGVQGESIKIKLIE